MNILLDIKQFLIPEMIMLILIFSNIVFSVFLNKKQQKNLFFFNIVGVCATLLSFRTIITISQIEILNGAYLSNLFCTITKVAIVMGCLFTVFLSKNFIEKMNKNECEYFALLFTATLGAMFLVCSNDLIMLITALETLGISSYMLSAYIKNDKRSNEAGLKYLVTGGVALAVLLYGFSFVYGITAETNLHQIFLSMISYKPNFILALAGIFVISGLCFKLAAVPFYNWAPDVYEGAPIPVAAYLSVVSKIAGLVILAKIIFAIFRNEPYLSAILAIIAIFTMTIGNLTALRQTNIKRLMAYSSIAQVGYIITGLALRSTAGISAVSYYLMMYFFMNFGAWAAIELFTTQTQKSEIKDFSGVAYKNPTFALCFSICLISLAGIPITAGFFAKFYLFMNLALASRIFLILLFIALINTLIALYYYLNVVKVMFENNSENKLNVSDLINKDTTYSNTVLLVSTLATIFLGFCSSDLIIFLQNISKGFLN